MGQNPTIKSLLCIITLLSIKTAFSYDNSHFYRAKFFWGEPRFEKKYLSSVDAFFATGSTCEGRDCCGYKTCLLDIYGCHNMQFLGKNVPCKNLERDIDLILHQLAQFPANNDFAKLSFKGEFEIREAVFSYYQNFLKGVFFHFHMPFRKLKISSIRYCDISEKVDPNCAHVGCCCAFADENTYWEAFLNAFETILHCYNLNIGNSSERGIGDTSIALGWTNNYEETEYIDYVDTTIRVGVTIPTSKERNDDCIFSLPLGYNGHTGIFGAADVSVGMYDWFTLGAHFDIMGFTSKLKRIRVKTAFEQNGFIKLAKEVAKVKKGPLFNIGLFAKADHVVGGFSLLVGYSYTRKNRDTLEFTSCCDTCIDCEIANTDSMLQEWTMHTIHFFGEYDFTQEDWTVGPRLNAFYNLVAGGRRIFNTGMGGAGIGFEITY